MAPRYSDDSSSSSSGDVTQHTKQPTHKDFRIGWICPLEVEETAASMMLDEQFEDLPQPVSDHNAYTLGRMGKHNVVIASLPTPDNCSAAAVATSMRRTFPRLEFALLVGIGGGVPVTTENGPIRLGHVVVSKATDQHSGTIQWDHGKAVESHFVTKSYVEQPHPRAMGQIAGQQRPGMIENPLGQILDSQLVRRGSPEPSVSIVVNQPTDKQTFDTAQLHQERIAPDGFIRRGYVEPPPTVLVNAARKLAISLIKSPTDQLLSNVNKINTSNRKLRRFRFPGRAQDRLFRADYRHRTQGQSCEQCGCDPEQMITARDAEENDAEEGQPDEIVVHRGTIATGEKVMGDASLRDRLGRQENILCFETEAAGALRGLPCLTIRGISDYCDSHKNDAWQGYAAATAASYARLLFDFIPPVYEMDEVDRAPRPSKVRRKARGSSGTTYSQYIGTNHGIALGESTGNINLTINGGRH